MMVAEVKTFGELRINNYQQPLSGVAFYVELMAVSSMVLSGTEGDCYPGSKPVRTAGRMAGVVHAI